MCSCDGPYHTVCQRCSSSHTQDRIRRDNVKEMSHVMSTASAPVHRGLCNCELLPPVTPLSLSLSLCPVCLPAAASATVLPHQPLSSMHSHASQSAPRLRRPVIFIKRKQAREITVDTDARGQSVGRVPEPVSELPLTGSQQQSVF